MKKLYRTSTAFTVNTAAVRSKISLIQDLPLTEAKLPKEDYIVETLSDSCNLQLRDSLSWKQYVSI